MSYYRIKPNNRGACLARIEAARRVNQPRHAYGRDGDVRVIAPMHRNDDLLGGAFRDAFPVHQSKEWREASPSRGLHTGWFTDPFGDGGTCYGKVAYLGHGRWLAGYEFSDNDCGAYHLDTFYDSELDAARAADSLAEWAAEKEREHQQRFMEAVQLQDAIEDKQHRLRELLALRHNKCLGYVHAEIAETIEAIREARASLAEYQDVL